MTLAERLRAALAGPPSEPLIASDYYWMSGLPDDAPLAAAVLIAVVDRPEPGVILTQRPEHMRRHPGQVAFPGGRLDPGEDAVAAALREADEEIALPPAAVEVVQTIDRYRTGTGFEITPVIGVVPPDLPLVPHAAEVAAVFEVPLAFLLDRANHVETSMEFRGAPRRYHEMHWADRRIWGATAAIIVNLSRRLAWP